jgi:DNA-binding beta-propeller fold protein YncE
MKTGDHSSFIARMGVSRGTRIGRSAVLASVGVLSVATILSTASVVEASGTSGAKTVTAPTFMKTLAGPAVANMYSSGTEWDPKNNRIVVADTGNDQIEFYSPTTGKRTGMFSTFGSGNGQLNSPRDIAIDGSANIYVADAGNNRVQKFTSNGTFVWATQGTPTSKCKSTLANSTCLNAAIGVTWDATNNVLLVADTGDSLIKAFDANGNWLWTSPAGATLGVINPRDVTRGPGGYLWVSAYQENQIKAFAVTNDGAWTTKPKLVLGDGTVGGKGNNELQDPYNVAFSPDGTIAYVSDIGNDRIAVYNIAILSNPIWLGQYGKRCNEPCPSPVTSGEFAFLRRVAVESNGDVIGDDFWGNGMFVFPPARIPFTAGAPLLQIEGYHAPAPGFAQAFGVSVATTGTIYTIDRLNQRIEEFSSTGAFMTAAAFRGVGADAFSWPEDAAAAPDGTLWVADTRNARLEHWPGNLSSVGVTDVGGKGAGLGQFNYPEGLTVASNGVVWVADSMNNRVESYTPSSGKFAVYGSVGSGTCQFNHPEAVTVGSGGKIYVADTLNNRVVEMTVSTGACTGFTATYSTGISGPQGITVASDGTVWVANSADDNIVHLSATLTNVGDGFGGPGTGNLQFDDPHTLAVSGHTLYVADTYNNRVQEFNTTGS